jgi:hypothetical protein
MMTKNTILKGVLTIATLAFLLGAVMDLGTMVSFGGSLTSNIVANANVLPTCFISLSPSTITFTAMSPTQNTMTTSNAVTDNDVGGNAAASILVAGGTGTYSGSWSSATWVGTTAGDANTIGITNTVYLGATEQYYTAFQATNSITNTLSSTIGTVAAPNTLATTTNVVLYFGMAIPAAQHADTYTTNILIENSC